MQAAASVSPSALSLVRLNVPVGLPTSVSSVAMILLVSAARPLLTMGHSHCPMELAVAMTMSVLM